MSLPALPFSKTRRAAGLIFLSGELPLSSDGSVPAGIGAQTDLVLSRIAATLASLGSSLADVISCTVYLADKVHVCSKRPGRIVTTRTVDLPHPRDKYAPEFVALVRELHDGIAEVRAS